MWVCVSCGREVRCWDPSCLCTFSLYFLAIQLWILVEMNVYFWSYHVMRVSIISIGVLCMLSFSILLGHILPSIVPSHHIPVYLPLLSPLSKIVKDRGGTGSQIDVNGKSTGQVKEIHFPVACLSLHSFSYLTVANYVWPCPDPYLIQTATLTLTLNSALTLPLNRMCLLDSGLARWEERGRPHNL